MPERQTMKRTARMHFPIPRVAQSLGFSDPAELTGKTDIDLFGEAFGQGTRLANTRS